MILVTGATGILGRVIVLELLKRGKKVRAAKRSGSRIDEVEKSFRFYTENPEKWFAKIEWKEVDFEDQDSLVAVLEDVEEVYHCAAKVSFNPADKAEMFRTNIEGTKQLLYAVEKSSVRKFLYVSSIAVLDGFNEKGELDENSDYNYKLDHSDYAVSKQFAEMEVWRASAEGLNTVIINPGMIIGSGNWQQSSGELFRTFARTKYTFSGGTAYVDVRDVAYSAIELMENNVFGERFIIVSENKTYEEIGNQIRKKLGLSPVKIIPDAVLKSAHFLSVFGFLFPKLKMINRSNIEAITTNHKISNEKICRKLNHQFIPVSESIDFHLNHYIEDKKP